MKHVFLKYKLQLVKETSVKYECDNKITSPDNIKNICYNVYGLNNECEEVLLLLALDIKLKVIGIFEVSRGSLDTLTTHPREIFKRLLLCNAHSFILAYNHPSGDARPSNDDINICEKIHDCAVTMRINLIDFCIIGDEFYSFKEHKIL